MKDETGKPMNIVHRDVSPQNILISYAGEVKLIDFGIAKAVGRQTKTSSGSIKGKFGYMSPEQVRGLPLDKRSDVFSAGIVLYEVLTGERLFLGESDFSTLEKVRDEYTSNPGTTDFMIRKAIERHFNIEMVNEEVFNYPDVQIRQQGGVFQVTAAYEHVVPLVANVSFLVDFDKTVEIQAR